MTIVASFCTLSALLIAGKLLRVWVRPLARLYLPSSVIAGILGLCIIQTVGPSLPDMLIAGWGKLPGFLINIVFAALFLGATIPSFRTFAYLGHILDRIVCHHTYQVLLRAETAPDRG